MRSRWWCVCAATLLAASLGGIVPAAAAQAKSRAVFVVNNVSDEISVLRVEPEGTLRLLGNYPTGDWPTPLALSWDGRYLAVAHATAATDELLQIFEVSFDGSLTLAAARTVPDAPLGMTWIGEDKLAVTESHVGDTNYVHTYDFDAGAGTIAHIAQYEAGQFNTSLVFWTGGWILYAQDSFANMIRWFAVNADGTLQFISSVNTGAVFPLEMGIAENGPYLYSAGGTSQDRHRVLGYNIGWATGNLTPLPGSPFYSPGNSPAHVAVSADNRWLFVGHGADATVHSFAIGQQGDLTYTGFMFDVGMQGTLGDVAVLDRLLLITDESTAGDGVKGIYSFVIEENGSFTMLGDIVDLGQRPESIATWVPPPLPGDLNGDGCVDQADLGILLADWGCAGGDCPGDCDGDGDTDHSDLGILLAHWGEGCP